MICSVIYLSVITYSSVQVSILSELPLLKKCYPNLHIDESRAGQNYQLLLPIAYRYNYAYINKVLYTYILHPTSHSNSNSMMNKLSWNVLRDKNVFC